MGSSSSKDGATEGEEKEQEATPGLWTSVKQGYGEIVNAIIRPPRAEYSDSDLGPASFTYGGRDFQRVDFELTNERGHKLMCSQWQPTEAHRPAKELPCLIYLHGNSSCRLGCMDNLDVVLSLGMTMVSLDFSGSGRSGGDWVTLGEYEKDDVACVIEHLRKSGSVSTIGLWGRSMGAATALLHSHRDPSIAAIVLDSPFADLRQLANEMVEMGKEQSGYRVPGLLVKAAIKMVSQSVWKKAQMDINKLKPIENVDKAFTPALFCHASGDNFIRVHHSRQIYEKYAGDKNLVVVDGDHNSPRPAFFQHSASIFLRNALRVPDDIVIPGDPDMRENLMSSFTRAERRRTGGSRGATAAQVRQREMEEEMMRQVMAMSLLTASGGRTRAGGGDEAGGGAGSGAEALPSAAESSGDDGEDSGAAAKGVSRGRGSSGEPAELMDEPLLRWPPADAREPWSCGACTYLNPAMRSTCEVCFEPRDPASAEAAAAPTISRETRSDSEDLLSMGNLLVEVPGEASATAAAPLDSSEGEGPGEGTGAAPP